MKKLVLGLVLFFGLCCLGVLAGGIGVYFWAVKDLPKIKTITDYNPPLTSTVFSRNNEVLGYLSRENRFLRPLSKMPPHVPDAFLAAEDASFYEHPGIDLMGIVRAAIKNLMAGDIVQGGSTITQQVIKSLLLTPERSYKRKLKEAILAYRLEKNLDKDEILTIYLNQIYFGHSAYGIEAAARTYFAKHASDLSLAEAALLAALPKAPSHYDPYKRPGKAKIRQTAILRHMLELDWIDAERYGQALEESLDYASMPDPSWSIGASFLEEVRRWLLVEFGEEATYGGGLKVYTTVDLKHQQAAEASLRKGLEASTRRRGWRGPIEHLPEEHYPGFLEKASENKAAPGPDEWFRVLVQEVSKDGAEVFFQDQEGWIDVASMGWCRPLDPAKAPEEVPQIKDARQVLKPGDVVWAAMAPEQKEGEAGLLLELRQKPVVEGALISLLPQNGDVLAMVGGYSFEQSQFNRATQARRQTGSAFKPIVYSAALDNGMTPASVLLDAPVVYTDKSTQTTWKPENYEMTSFGPTLLRTALVSSRNLVTIRVARQIGIDTVIQRARQLQLEAEFPRNLSVSLGSASVSLLNLCEAYSAFPRGGSTVEPRLVVKVEDAWGQTLYTGKPAPHQAISRQTAYIITYLMQQVVQHGTGWRVKALNRPVAGKTGTTDDQKDAWFMGFAPYLLTGVFVGFDEPRPMGKYETGSRAAAPIWLGYRQAVEEAYPVQDFKRPPGVVMARIDAKNGLLAGPGSEKTYVLPFKAGTQPTKISPAGRAGNQQEPGRDGVEEEAQDGEAMLKEIF
jgi:penicillin-binding protein 1A